MELEEMKNVWTELSAHIETKKKLTDKTIIAMKQGQYQNKLDKIRKPEVVGAAIAVAAAILILIKFDNYEGLMEIAGAVISACLLLLISLLSISAVYKMKSLNVGDDSFKQTLTAYARSKRNMVLTQKRIFLLSHLLLVAILPVMIKTIGGKGTAIPVEVWTWYLPLLFVLFLVLGRWVYHYYNKAANEAEALLKELAE